MLLFQPALLPQFLYVYYVQYTVLLAVLYTVYYIYMRCVLLADVSTLAFAEKRTIGRKNKKEEEEEEPADSIRGK